MTPSEYIAATRRTWNPKLSRREQQANASMGVSGEAGECLELYKKHLFHANPLDRNKLVKELGDVFYYVARLCDLEGITFEDIMTENVRKLQQRYPHGFDPNYSSERD